MNDLSDALESAHATMVFDSRDWAAKKRDAWLYGLLVGWDGPAMRELQAKFGWSDDDVRRLRRLRRAIKGAKSE